MGHLKSFEMPHFCDLPLFFRARMFIAENWVYLDERFVELSAHLGNIIEAPGRAFTKSGVLGGLGSRQPQAVHKNLEI
jgi:hypothetical protein